MTDVGIDTGTPAPPPTEVTAPAGSPDKVGVSEAARLLRSARRPAKEPSEINDAVRPGAGSPTPRADAALEAIKSTAQAEDAGQETAPSETQVADPVAELPSIEPPRSWTKEDKELFAGLPRETQERLADRERSRDTETSKRLQKAAEDAKALEGERGKVEQARQQYESALPILMQNLQTAMAGEFSDIKSMQDMQRMAAEDWPRYIRWDAAQKQVAAVQQEVLAAQQRQQTEAQTKFAEFAKREGELFLEAVPDMADPVKAKALQDAAMTTLASAGFETNELAQAWQGHINVPFRDHRVQLMIHKAALWDQAQAKAKTVVNNAKPLPPVQRPGAAQPKGAAQAAQIENLGKKIDGARNYTEGAKLGAQLLKARRSAR